MIMSAEEFVSLRTSEDPDLYTRAAHEPAPDEVWLDLIARYPEMKRWVIHNKTVPLHILELLSQDNEVDVRLWVATKRKAGHLILERLAGDPEPSVRRQVAYNAKTPAYILQRLATDEAGEVAEVARARLKTLNG